MDADKLAKAAALRAEADRLEKQAFVERSLPDKWRLGQKVRYLRDSEWAWAKGEIAYVKGFREHADLPAAQYQVFYTGPGGRDFSFWTTPDDVELVEDVASTDA